MIRTFRPLALAAACVITASCGASALSLGGSAQQSRARASELIGALIDRFGPLELDASFADRRTRLSRAALVPSRAFKDASLWTGDEGAARLLEFGGGRRAGRYGIRAHSHVPVPAAPGEYRGRLRLRALPNGEYEWQGRDELAVGTVGAGGLDRALTALLLAAEEVRTTEGPALVAAELPRTAAALGRLFALEQLGLSAVQGGGTSVTAVAALRPAGIEKDFPRYARYVRKYIVPALFHAVAVDSEGRRWWHVNGREGRFTLRLRVSGGSLAPLEGPPRRIPERLQVRGGFSTRFGIFRLGVHSIEAEVHLVRAPREKALAAVFKREPDWQLPFVLEPLLRASLRRPFAGEGARLAFAVREGAGQTLLVRDYHVAVRESWIVRWLGGRTQAAMDEFRQGAEEEAGRFMGQALGALLEDLHALLAGAPGAANGPRVRGRLGRSTTAQ